MNEKTPWKDEKLGIVGNTITFISVGKMLMNGSDT